MAQAWSRSRLVPSATAAYLVGAGTVATATYGFLLRSETRLVEGRVVVDGFVEFLMLGLPAVGLLYAGYWMHDAGFAPNEVRRIGGFAVGGSALGGLVTGVALAAVPIPSLDAPATFALFVSTATEGGLLGVLVGTFAATRELLGRERAAAEEYEMLHGLLRHNVRNRLTVLSGHATRLAEGAGADGMAAIETQVEAIDDLLGATKLATEAIGGRAEPSPVDLVAVVERQCRLLESSHDAVAVTTDLPERAVVTGGDLLAPVVENLLENAVVHNDTPVPEVSVRVAVTDDTVRLAVADDGPGVPPDRRRAAFEAGTGDGTGMGLYLARTVIERYGGSVELGANEPRGTVVTVTLPRADQPA